MVKKTSVLKKMVDEAVTDLRHGNFPSDPRLDDAEELSGPERFAKGQKSKDEVIIDSQLSAIAGIAGYYLKLKKEVRPGEYMMMKVLENEWRNWADVEVGVTNIVREHTKAAPMKWGTGVYRIEYGCKSGFRGKNYDPVNFHINAEEEFLNTTQMQQGGPQQIDPSVQMTSTLETVGTLMRAVKDIMPVQAPPVDPGKVQEQMAGAFQQGLQVKVNDAASSSNSQLQMMTMMMGMMKEVFSATRQEPRVVNNDETMRGTLELLKTFGLIGQNITPAKEKGLIEILTELKAIGVDLFKKDDPLESIGKLKQIAGIAADFMGMGGTSERPSIFEKIVDVIGPSIPKMISDIKDATQNTVKVQEIAGQNIRIANQRQVQGPQSEIPQSSGEPTTYQAMSGGQVNQGQSGMNEQVKQFFSSLHEAVIANNRMFYPVVYTSLLQEAKGQTLLNGIVAGTSNAKNLIDLLQEYGDERYKNSEFVMKSLVSYVNGFIIWVRNMAGVSQPIPEPVVHVIQPEKSPVVTGTEYDVRCTVCGTVFTYSNEQEYLTDSDKTCGKDGTCTGSIEPIVTGNA